MSDSERVDGLERTDVVDLLMRLVDRGADYADAFIEDSALRTVAYSERRIGSVSSGHRSGIGVRFLREGRQYLAHTSEITVDGVRRAVDELVPLLAGHPSTLPTGGDVVRPVPSRSRLAVGATPIPAEQCRALVEAASGGVDDAVEIDGCDVDLEASRRSIRIINTEGIDAASTTHRTELTVDCTIDRGDGLDNGRRNRGESGTPGDFPLDLAHELGRRTGEQALSRAEAIPAPTGEVDVIIAAGTAGVVFHETVGHGLEADLVQSFESVYSGRLGTRVGAAGLSVVDDGTRANGWGSAPTDDEGTPATRTTLVRDGVLEGYLSDRAATGRAGGELTANSRRGTYADLPYVRMTNTLVEPGGTRPGDIIADTEFGILVSHLRGGGFNPGTGHFLFSTSEASLVEAGRIVGPIRNATFVGNALDALLAIDGIGDDFEMVAGGRCGKRGQTIPVGFGAPTVRLRRLTIGGS